ncbi:MAG: hypothetical protein HY935_06115 [Nitrosomonadales bacterium]|nr:hypothetical protein [Nitrosomonadales bacterium]
MRIKSHWFKSGHKRTPQEIAGALAFVIWRIGDNALKNTRKANFEIEIGAQYFSFLTEFLIFLVQVADRIAYRQLPAEDRSAFTSFLANRVAETLAENQSRLTGNGFEIHKQHFIDKLNQRSGEYAEFGYGSDGPEFAFTRYLGFCMREVLGENDSNWIIDQMMSIGAPEAVSMMEKTMRDLFETEPGQPRIRNTVSGD